MFPSRYPFSHSQSLNCPYIPFHPSTAHLSATHPSNMYPSTWQSVLLLVIAPQVLTSWDIWCATRNSVIKMWNRTLRHYDLNFSLSTRSSMILSISLIEVLGRTKEIDDRVSKLETDQFASTTQLLLPTRLYQQYDRQEKRYCRAVIVNSKGLTIFCYLLFGCINNRIHNKKEIGEQ